MVPILLCLVCCHALILLITPQAEADEPTSPHVPGVVIAHRAAAGGVYIGSPSLAILADGDYVASHDEFGPRSTSSHTLVYRSQDRGISWEPLAEIDGQYWSTLFVHRGTLYIIGTSSEYGNAVIRRSDDGGKTWTTPRDGGSGLLLTGGQYHCAPVPVVEHAGRLWRAMERRHPATGWAENFEALVLSVPEDADLLSARNWRVSDTLPYDHAWSFHAWLEGNVVVTPSGHLVDILRTDSHETETAAIVRISDDGRSLRFDPHADLIPLPGACKKFTIRYDPASRLYWSLTSDMPALYPGRIPGEIRNQLVLISSPDLKTWAVRSRLLSHPDSIKHGFQYVDWQFDGADIIFVTRTAYDDALVGAHNYHDANYLTFHHVAHFRR